MQQAIVIGATPDGLPWVSDLMASLKGCRWPIEVHETWDFELSTIAWAGQRYDEFVFLPQTTEVLDQRLFELCFLTHRGRSVNLGTAQEMQFRMYLGKYRADALNQIAIPRVTSKREAVHWEVVWCKGYAWAEATRDRLVSVGGPLEHSDVFEQRHGRLNMVVENEFLRRLKGTWDVSMIKERVG